MTEANDDPTGPKGYAEHIPRSYYAVGSPAMLSAWLITAPDEHPLWSQFLLSMISLADIPGTEAAYRQYPEATHELLLMTLNPAHGPYTRDTFAHPDGISFLMPPNVVHQFTSTDAKAIHLAELCVRAVLDGLLRADVGDAPQALRAHWAQTIRDTLDHDQH